MPSSTDVRIDSIVSAIRDLCGRELTPGTELKLRELARELRLAIREHVEMAKSSLDPRKTAISELDRR